jgi:tryptophan-rich sensory protein
VVFFGAKAPGWAFIVIIAMWLAIAVTILKFYKVSKSAAYILIPYIAWVSFAALLNYSVWQLN